MQAPTASPPPMQASPNPLRTGRSSSAPDPATPPGDFTKALDQALVTPGPQAPTTPGAAAAPPANTPTEPAAPAAVPPKPARITPAVGKCATGGPASPAAEPAPDQQPASPHAPDAAPLLTLPQPPVSPPPMSPPVPATAAQPPSPEAPSAADPAHGAAVADNIPVGAPAAGPAATTDDAPAGRAPGQPVPSAPLPLLHGMTPSGPAGAAVHTAAGNPDAGTLNDTAAAVLALADDAPASKLAAPIPAGAWAPPTAPHLAAAPLSLARPPATAAPSPAEQVGPALASFTLSPAQPGGPQHLTIRLDPADLGRVQMRIERTPGGPARVDLIVERPDTLLLLLRDQPQLHRALDLAGVPAADRTLQYHLAPPTAPAPGTAASGTAASQPNADPGSGQHRPAQPAHHRGSDVGHRGFQDDPNPPPALAFRRAGVDITA